MTTRPWMPLWIGDYRGKTAHLGCLEHGAYLLLIMHYWITGGLPNDDNQLARIACCTPKEWNGIRGTIAAFFEPGWKHDRIEEELAKAAEQHKKRVDAGRKGGEATADAKQCSSNAPPLPQQSHSPSLPQSSLKDSFFRGIGGVKKGEEPPRNGQTAPRVGRIYVVKGTPEWDAYAEDYRSAHNGREPDANKHGGKWFKTLGERSPVTYRQKTA